MEEWIWRAIYTIRERYDEPLSLDDLAKTAAMSKFHFLRTFSHMTGVTPVRYLSAVRIHEAKRLLFSTPLSVAEISIQVGYGSLGTFTRRFTKCVGLSPTLYRRMARGEQVPGVTDSPHEPNRQVGQVTGWARTVPHTTSLVFLGMFSSRVLQDRPVAWVMVPQPGPWTMPAVPSGTWYLIAVATQDDPPTEPSRTPADRALLVATSEAVRISPNRSIHLNVTLHPRDSTRPPLLYALPGIEASRAAASRTAA
jgi:AraC-like DNA-binding protein